MVTIIMYCTMQHIFLINEVLTLNLKTGPVSPGGGWGTWSVYNVQEQDTWDLSSNPQSRVWLGLVKRSTLGKIRNRYSFKTALIFPWS